MFLKHVGLNTQYHICWLFSILPQIEFNVKENGCAIEHYHKIAIAALQNPHLSLQAAAKHSQAHLGALVSQESFLIAFFPDLSANIFVWTPNEQDQMNYSHSELLCWTVTTAQYPSQFRFALWSQLPEFPNGKKKTYFTVKFGKVTAKKLFSWVILNASTQSMLRYSKKQRMGE